MKSFYYLYDAKKRMKEIERFIKGTPDIPMLLAQRDIIQKEIDHYWEQTWNLLYFFLTFAAFSIILCIFVYFSYIIFYIIRILS